MSEWQSRKADYGLGHWMKDSCEDFADVEKWAGKQESHAKAGDKFQSRKLKVRSFQEIVEMVLELSHSGLRE